VQFGYGTVGVGHARAPYMELRYRTSGIMQKACKNAYKLYMCQLAENQ